MLLLMKTFSNRAIRIVDMLLFIADYLTDRSDWKKITFTYSSTL